MDLGKKDAALAAAETKLETLKAHQSNQQEHIGVLQTSVSAKEQHIKNLQGEVRLACSSVVFDTYALHCCLQKLVTGTDMHGHYIVATGEITC